MQSNLPAVFYIKITILSSRAPSTYGAIGSKECPPSCPASLWPNVRRAVSRMNPTIRHRDVRDFWVSYVEGGLSKPERARLFPSSAKPTRYIDRDPLKNGTLLPGWSFSSTKLAASGGTHMKWGRGRGKKRGYLPRQPDQLNQPWQSRGRGDRCCSQIASRSTEVLFWILQAPSISKKAEKQGPSRGDKRCLLLGGRSTYTFTTPKSPQKTSSLETAASSRNRTQPAYNAPPWPDRMKNPTFEKSHFDTSEVRKNVKRGKAPDQVDFQGYIMNVLKTTCHPVEKKCEEFYSARPCCAWCLGAGGEANIALLPPQKKKDKGLTSGKNYRLISLLINEYESFTILRQLRESDKDFTEFCSSWLWPIWISTQKTIKG